MNRWHKIPDFPRYEVSDGLQVRKSENLQVIKKDFHSIYLARNGIRYGFDVRELLAAALAGREPQPKYARRKVEKVRVTNREKPLPFAVVPCPQTEALLNTWARNPLMSGLDAAERCVGY